LPTTITHACFCTSSRPVSARGRPFETGPPRHDGRLGGKGRSTCPPVPIQSTIGGAMGGRRYGRAQLCPGGGGQWPRVVAGQSRHERTEWIGAAALQLPADVREKLAGEAVWVAAPTQGD